jgi:hypothetical protein
VIELPEWADELIARDRDSFAERLRRLPPEDHEKEIGYWRELSQDPAYKVVKAVVYDRSQKHLEEKPIILPVIPCDDERVREDWARRGDSDTATWGELYADVQKADDEQWIKTVRNFEREPLDFYNAWWFLNNHPAFWQFNGDGSQSPKERIHHKNLMRDNGITRSVRIDVVKVDPLTKHHEDDESLNTHTQVWIEMGKWEWPSTKPVDEHSLRDAHFHDHELDCGGDSFETAIIVAAICLHTVYGNDRIICDSKDPWLDASQVAELASWYDTHDAFGNLLPSNEWAHGSVPPEEEK